MRLGSLLLCTVALLFSLALHGVVIAPDPSKPCLIILFGPPGSGRATIGVKLCSCRDIRHFSCANLLLEQLNGDSEIATQARTLLHSGKPPSDALLFDILAKRMERADCIRGFLLDDFPRTVAQAKELKRLAGGRYQFLVLYIRASDTFLLRRAEHRLICQNCGRVYHELFSRPQREMQCDLCNLKLVRRSEDSPENVKKKHNDYCLEIAPILDFYTKEGLLTEIDGDHELVEIFETVDHLVPEMRES